MFKTSDLPGALHLGRLFPALLVAVALLAQASSSSAALVVGGFDLGRGGDFSIADSPSTQMSLARSIFQSVEPATIFTGAPVLTPAYLANVDIVVLSAVRYEPTTVVPLSSAEQSALFNFVASGGRALIVTEHSGLGSGSEDPVYESLIDPFGLNVDGSITATATLSDPSHPIFDGPFGTVASVETSASGYYSDLGPYATGLAFLGGDPSRPMIATIERNGIMPGSGRVIFLADGNVLDIEEVPVAQALALAGNGVAYLAVPESGTLALIGSVTTILAVSWRRRVLGTSP